MIFKPHFPLLVRLSGLSLVGIVSWYLYKTKLKKYINKDERQKYFAEMMSQFVHMHNRITKNEKDTLFGELISTDLKRDDPLNILEIGAGSGANLRYYPEGSRISIVEPNPYFEEYFMENLKKFPGLQLVEYYKITAEDMNEINTESFDIVVSTVVACSVTNLQKVYEEVQRVLVPGGKFLYLEHVLDHPRTLLYYKQQLLTYLYIWPLLFDGCHLNKNVVKEINKSRFSQVNQRTFYIPTSEYWVLPYVKPHVVGVAIK